LIHVDGKHDYTHVVQDTLNLRRFATADTLYLYDDICDANLCSVSDNMFAGAPALAICDLLRSGLLQGPIDAVFNGTKRQWGVFRAGNAQVPSTGLPKAPRCNITWASQSMQSFWHGNSQARRAFSMQKALEHVSLPRVHTGLPSSKEVRERQDAAFRNKHSGQISAMGSPAVADPAGGGVADPLNTFFR
jgi:hypothetical protein